MATFGKGVEYALHCMAYLVDTPQGVALRVSDLAEFQGVSETYLAKIFTKLTRADLIRSSVGAKGGYELSRPAEQITFWDVVVAVEGRLKLFECRNIRAGCVLYKDQDQKPEWLTGGTCSIHAVMIEAEQQVIKTLKAKTLRWLCDITGKKLPPQDLDKFEQWFFDKLR